MTQFPAPTDLIVPRLDVRVRRRDGTVFLGYGEQAVELSDVAAFLWSSIDGKRTVDELARLLVEEYGVDTEAAGADLGEFLAFLQQYDFVNIVPAAAPRRPDGPR
jgi:hypothetical protein